MCNVDCFIFKPKQTSPSGSDARKKKSSPPSEDSAKLRNLKRYARSCGMHFKYVDIFADCNSMAQKERMLDKLIRDRTGFEGKKLLIISRTLIFAPK